VTCVFLGHRLKFCWPGSALRTFELASICLSKEVLYSVLAWTHSEVRRNLSGLNSLDGEKDFIWPELARRREGLYLAWTRSTARRTLSGASTCPRATFSLDALRTFNLIFPKLTQGWGGLSLVPQLAQGLPFPCMHWGLLISSCLNSLEGEEDFLWCRV